MAAELELYRVAMPLSEPWRIAISEETAIETVLLCLHTEWGSLWAETTPHALPLYSPDWSAATFELLCHLGPRLLTAEWTSAAALRRELDQIRGNPFAKAAIDQLWWKREAARRGITLHAALGATATAAPVGADIGILGDRDELLARVQAAVDAGYRRVKLKVRPGWDVEEVRCVRDHFPRLTLHVDGNGAYSLHDIDRLRALDRCGLAMIEQPLAHDDLVDHATLQRALLTPICLDESIVSLRHLDHALALGSCRVVNVKPGRVGGFTPALAIVERCRESGIGAWIGGMLESAIGAADCVALACLAGITYPADIFPSERFYERDLAAPGLRFETRPDVGRVVLAAAEAPAPDPELLARWTTARRSFALTAA